MKRIIILIVILLAMPISCEASEKTITLLAMSLIDFNQSVEMFYGRGKGEFIEFNPLLNGKPSRESMILMGSAGITIYYAIEELVKEGFWKDLVLDSVLATEKLNIEDNRYALKTGHRPFKCLMIVFTGKF